MKNSQYVQVCCAREIAPNHKNGKEKSRAEEDYEFQSENSCRGNFALLRPFLVLKTPISVYWVINLPMDKTPRPSSVHTDFESK